jgi:hypothetical protein
MREAPQPAAADARGRLTRRRSGRGLASTLGALWAGLPPLALAVLVTAAYAAYVVWRLRGTGGDPSFFVIAGPLATDPRATLPNLYVHPAGTTYDGQFFYRLALEPWTHAQTAHGIALDEPAYRQQRILYPLLAWAISGGQWQLTPVALIVTNLVAVGALAYAAAALAAHLGRHVFAALLVPLYPGYLVTISRDLAELTEAALMVAGVALLARRRYAWAGAALTAGMLAKETLLVVPIAGIVVWIWRRVRGQHDLGAPLGVWAAPIVAYVVWSAILAVRWGTTGFSQGSVNFGPPFQALEQRLGALGVGTNAWSEYLGEWERLGLLVAVPLAALAVRPWRLTVGSILIVACGLYAAAASLYTTFVWRDEYAYLRALHELELCAALALLAAGVWATRLMGAATSVMWLAFAYLIGRVP